MKYLYRAMLKSIRSLIMYMYASISVFQTISIMVLFLSYLDYFVLRRKIFMLGNMRRKNSGTYSLKVLISNPSPSGVSVALFFVSKTRHKYQSI